MTALYALLEGWIRYLPTDRFIGWGLNTDLGATAPPGLYTIISTTSFSTLHFFWPTIGSSTRVRAQHTTAIKHICIAAGPSETTP